MGVRVWGELEDRLVEICVAAGGACDDGGGGLRIHGLPERVGRTAGDRIRAGLLNSGLVVDPPVAVVRLTPDIDAGPVSELDVPIALAVLCRARVIHPGLRWIVASGRLGLDGSVHREGSTGDATLADVVRYLNVVPVR